MEESLLRVSLNRSLLLVRGKQPYADWANSFDDGGPRLDLAEHRQDANAYLVVDHEETGDLDNLVELHWEDIFGSELDAWMRDRKTWPVNRTRSMFWQWFDVDFASLVFDLGDQPLEW